MCFEHVAGGYYSFFKAQIGVTQVFVGFFQVLLGHGQLFGRFAHFEGRLADLQFYLLLGFFQLVAGDAGFRLGCLYLVDAFTPVPYRHRYDYAYVPHAFELLFKAVEDGRIGSDVVSHQGDGGQVGRAFYVYLLLVYLCRKLQTAYFGAQTVHLLQVDAVGRDGGQGQVFFLFVGQGDGAVQVQSAQLAQQHARQAQSVVYLSHGYFGFVHLYLYRQSVGFGSHSFGYHLLHVAVQLLQQLQVAFGQPFLIGKRHHLPVGLVGAQYDVLHAAVVLLACQLFGISGNLVVGAYLSTHVEGLCQGQCSAIHVAGVGAEGVNERVAQIVERGGDVGTSQCLQQCHELRILYQFGVLCQQSLYAALHGAADLCTYRSECAFLCIAQQGEFFLVAHISACCRQLGEVVGECRFLLVVCGIDFFLAYQQFFVVGDGQCTTTIQAEDTLCAHGKGKEGQIDDT